MRAALFIEPHRVEVGDRRDPVIVEPTDAIVRVVLACVCGSDSGTTAATRRSSRGRSATSSSVSSRTSAATSRPSSAATFVMSIARPGSMVGYVGVPHGVELPIGDMFLRNKGVRGAYAAMDERRAIKSLVRIGNP